MEELNIKRSAIGSAPGSIDVLGGYAKAAGSLAIRALSEPKTTVLLTEISDPSLRLSSTRHGRFVCPIDSWKTMVRDRAEAGDLKTWLAANQAPRWAYHIIGSLFLFARRHQWVPEEGLSFAIASDLPERQGLGSGVALKVACLRALEKLTTRYSNPAEIESILSCVDASLLGVPFDPSSPLASALNKPGCLLPINCRQNVARTPIELPRGITLFSWTRKLTPRRDTVWYERRSLAAAMGSRIAASSIDLSHTDTLPPVSRFHSSLEATMPRSISGQDFESAFGTIDSPYSRLESTALYNVRDAFAFAVRENHRAELAIHLLSSMGLRSKRKAIEQMGELLWESHFECKLAGLEAALSDEMINALIEAGPEQGIYGGRLNCLGEDCTVIALAEKRAIAFLRRLAREIEQGSDEPFQII